MASIVPLASFVPVTLTLSPPLRSLHFPPVKAVTLFVCTVVPLMTKAKFGQRPETLATVPLTWATGEGGGGVGVGDGVGVGVGDGVGDGVGGGGADGGAVCVTV
jgi:hypothetical protein